MAEIYGIYGERREIYEIYGDGREIYESYGVYSDLWNAGIRCEPPLSNSLSASEDAISQKFEHIGNLARSLMFVAHSRTIVNSCFFLGLISFALLVP